MPNRLSQQWRDERFRQSLCTGLRGWNSALNAGLPEQARAAARLKQVWEQQEDAMESSALETAIVAGSESDSTPAQIIEQLLNFPSHRLAVYGSLAPGKKNHHMMTGMQGTWTSAVMRGSLRNEGWGAGQGFPGFLWDGTDTPVAAQVFLSPDLPGHWQRLDEFEGEEYRRILVPVELDGGEMEICNVYALAVED